MTALRVRRLAGLDPAERSRLLARATAQIFDPQLGASVAQIVEDVRTRGDRAVCDALARFDRVELEPDQLRVTREDIEAARARVDDDLLAAVRLGIRNIRLFNERALADASWRAEIAPGLTVGEQARPIASAGLFVPCGKGSFPSVLMHIGTPAVVAGVSEIVVLVPPVPGSAGEVDPAVLVVADELGLGTIVRVNGPAGIAAAAFGTETVPRTVKVVGPGSPAVTAAQIQVQVHGTTTAMLFGPSESVVIADESADLVRLAADLLNEAEHGSDSVALLVTDSEPLVERLHAELERQLAALPEPRRTYAADAISDLGGAILVRDLAEACAFVNEYAPEHLQIATADPESLLERIDHAGEILLGDTPFSGGNYLLGVPNTLPTGGFARVSSGITSRAFVKTSSIARTSPEALAALAPGIVRLAEHEGFPAHAAALRVRGLGGSGGR